MVFRKSYEGSILSRHKDTLLSTTSFSRTINLPFFWRPTASSQVQRKPSTPKTGVFLIKDIEIQYEPTDVMWLDVLTKPKQGNVPEDYDNKIEHLNTHHDLFPSAGDDDKLLATNIVVLVKALKQRLVPRKAISDGVVLKL